MYAMREALAAFRRAPVLTGLSSGMVGLALFVVGLFSLSTYNLQIALSAIEERVEVVVYLREDARQSEIDHLFGELAAFEEVSRVNYVSKRDALERAVGLLPMDPRVRRRLAGCYAVLGLEAKAQREEDVAELLEG